MIKSGFKLQEKDKNRTHNIYLVKHLSGVIPQKRVCETVRMRVMTYSITGLFYCFVFYTLNQEVSGLCSVVLTVYV